MTVSEPEDTGATAGLLQSVDSLGDSNWHVRRVAIDRLSAECIPELVPQLIEIVNTSHRDLSRLNAAIQVLTRSDADVLPALLPLLKEPDADVRAYVALILGERGDPRAIPMLIAALADPNTNVRVHSIEALGKLQAAEAVDLLIGFVDSRNFELAYPALDALTAIRDERIAYRLIPLLQDPLFDSAAIDALGALGDEEAVIPLLKTLEDAAIPAEAVARSIQQIHNRYLLRYGSGAAIADIVNSANSPVPLGRFRTMLSQAPVPEVAAVLAVIGWLPGDEAVAVLLDALEQPDLWRFSADALANRSSDVIPALLQRFGQVPHENRSGLVELCGRTGDRRTVPILLECLRGDDDQLIFATLEALSRIGGEQVYASAKAFLGHANGMVRQAAVAALNSLGHPATMSDMLALLQNSSLLPLESALKVAAYFGFPECVDPILACCDHSDPRIRRVAVEHLPCLDDPRVVERLDQALRSEHSPIRAAAAGALGEMESSAAIQLLRNALGDRDVWVRYFAVRSLAQIDREGEAQETLASLAADDSAMQVRIAAVPALRGQFLPLLMQLAESADEDLASAAIAALGASRRAEALPPLLAAAQSASRTKQIAAIRALGKTGLLSAVPPLSEMALRRDQLLAEEAIAALAGIPQTESIDALLQVVVISAKRLAATKALTCLGTMVIPTLASRLLGLPLGARRAVIDVLIRLRTRDALEVLETALNDPEPVVRHAALAALAHLGSDKHGKESFGSASNA